MSQLVNGIWQSEPFRPTSADGKFIRPDSQFRDRVTADGSSGFPAEPGRYHLYVSLACPWAHRTLIFRVLKGLQEIVSVAVVHPHMGEQGWEFRDCEGCTADTVNNFQYAHQLYTLAKPAYTGLVTVPILWDQQRRTIVNNESSEIIRMLNSEFNACGAAAVDFYPANLRAEIDTINDFVYARVNNGVYRAGFSSTQEAYEEAFDSLFAALDILEKRLSTQRFLVGDRLTEADWRLFPTLVRFDAVYYSHFKCNRQRLIDYPKLWAYTRELYQIPGVEGTVNLAHIKQHYFTSHPGINPSGIIPKGPALDFSAAHGRDRP